MKHLKTGHSAKSMKIGFDEQDVASGLYVAPSCCSKLYIKKTGSCFMAETWSEINVEKKYQVQFLGGYLCNIFTYKIQHAF